MGKIVFETNRYAKEQLHYIEKLRLIKLIDTTIEELCIFLAVNILMVRRELIT